MWKLIETKLKELNKNEAWLAKELCVPRGTVNNWKHGKNRMNRFDLVIKISDVLDIPLEEFAECVREKNV